MYKKYVDTRAYIETIVTDIAWNRYMKKLEVENLVLSDSL